GRSASPLYVATGVVNSCATYCPISPLSYQQLLATKELTSRQTVGVSPPMHKLYFSSSNTKYTTHDERNGFLPRQMKERQHMTESVKASQPPWADHAWS